LSLVASVLGVAIVLFAGSIYWQHARYLDARRGPVQDRQPLWYPEEAFHVVTFLVVPEGRQVIEEVRKLRSLIEASGDARMVYAGQAAFVALASEQLPEADWNAAFLVQYPTREAYEAMAGSESYRAVLASFPHNYSQGLKRPRALNLAMHQALLALRLRDLVTFAPSRLPFEKAEHIDDPRSRDRGAGFDKLAALKPLGEDAIVVVNLLKRGTPDQQAADRGYGLKMAGGMAEGGYGPMHMGRAVRVEGDADFDHVAMVYYPGVDFMRSMVESTFFNRIVGGKQPGDTLALITVPILGEL
jgi:hypothetical protein